MTLRLNHKDREIIWQRELQPVVKKRNRNIEPEKKKINAMVHTNNDGYPLMDKSFVGSRKNQTAWIFGSGVSLNEIETWGIPEGVVTIALNGGVVWFWDFEKKCFRRKLDYWMTFDRRVLNHRQLPEWDYAQMALNNPHTKKFIFEHIHCPSGFKNVHKFHLRKRNSHDKVFTKFHDEHLITGDSILTPALHFCYIAGFKRIFLSGVDMCCFKGKGKVERYCNQLSGMRHQGHHIQPMGSPKIAPNGEKVRVMTMYDRQINQIMPEIRFLQDSGIEVIKTSLRGMLPINALDTERTLNAIVKGESVNYKKGNGKA